MADKTVATLITDGAKIGEPVPRAIVDTNTASVGIPRQPKFNAHEEIGALRTQIDSLHQQVVEASFAVKSGARRAQAAVKLYPMTTIIGVAAAAALAFALTTARSGPRRSRYDVILDEMRDVINRLRS